MENENIPNQQPAPTDPAPAQPSDPVSQPTSPAVPNLSAQQPPAPPATFEAPQATAPTPQKRHIPKWLIVVGIVVLVIILFFVGLAIITNMAARNAVKVSDSLLSDLQANNESAAYSLTTPAFRNATSGAQLAATLSSLSPLYQGKYHIVGKAINKTSGQPEEAIIVYAVSTANGTKYVRVVLYNNNPWQVQNFRTSPTPLTTASAN